jgi:hypothetical protein
MNVLGLNKTVIAPTRSVSVKKKKKNYLTETISSANKKTVKYENTNIFTNLISCSTRIQQYNKKLYQSYKKNLLSSQKSNSFSDSNIYYDNYGHFSNTTDFGNDPFGHFD